MTIYRIETRGDAREVYLVEADSVDEAREAFEASPPLQPCVSEVTGTDVVSIEED